MVVVGLDQEPLAFSRIELLFMSGIESVSTEDDTLVGLSASQDEVSQGVDLGVSKLEVSTLV